MKRLVLVSRETDETFDEFVGYPLITTGTPEGNHIKIGITETDGFGDQEFSSVDELKEYFGDDGVCDLCDEVWSLFEEAA
jgi:hypothetical protein